MAPSRFRNKNKVLSLNNSVGFVGAGKMVSAIVKSLLRKDTFSVDEISCCSANDGTSEKLASKPGSQDLIPLKGCSLHPPPFWSWGVNLNKLTICRLRLQKRHQDVFSPLWLELRLKNSVSHSHMQKHCPLHAQHTRANRLRSNRLFIR